MTTEVLERAAEEAGWREAKGDLMRGKEGAQSEVQRLATEQRIETLETMEDGILEAKMRQGAQLRQEAEL